MDIEILKSANDNVRRDFYVYAWLRPSGEPFYIGKGCGKRDVVDKTHNPIFRRIAEKIRRDGGEPVVVRLHEGLTEEMAHDRERAEIAKYGRRDNKTGILANLTDGGEGTSGLSMSADAKAKIRQAHLGKLVSAETRLRISQAKANPSPETRAKISAANQNRNQEIRDKIASSLRGKKHSPDVVAKRSAALLGRKHTPEAISKMREAQLGKKHSAETLAKLSAIGRSNTEAIAKLVEIGRNPSEETRSKMRLSARMAAPRGEYKGIAFDRAGWVARIKTDCGRKTLGRFRTPEQAALAYDKAAVDAWGYGNCYLNFPEAANDNTQMSIPLAA